MQRAQKALPCGYPLPAALLTAGAVLLILFTRRPESFLHPQFFAEDGAVFYIGAHREPWGSILTPYAGYLHLASRLVATLCSGLDPLWVPTAYFSASLAAVITLSLALFSRRVELPRPAILALAVVLVPHTGEVFDNLTNLQWIMALGLIVLLLARDPHAPSQWLADFGFATLASLSGVFSVLFAPLFAFRAAVRRTGAAVGIASVVGAGAAIQAHAILSDASAPAANTTTAFLALATFGQRVWMSLLAPAQLADASPQWLRACVGFAGVALLLVLGLHSKAARLERAVLAVSLLLVVAAAIFRFRGAIQMLGCVENGDRYFFVPKVGLAWLLAMHVRRPSGLRWLSAALLVVLVGNTCLSFRFERWKDYDWAYWAGRIADGERVVVPINPDGFTFVYDGGKSGQ